MNPLAPVAVTEIRPVFNIAVIHHHDVLQAVTRHIGPYDARVGEIGVGKYLQCLALDPSIFIPALLRIVEVTFQTTTGTDGICYAITVQVYKKACKTY